MLLKGESQPSLVSAGSPPAGTYGQVLLMAQDNVNNIVELLGSRGLHSPPPMIASA